MARDDWSHWICHWVNFICAISSVFFFILLSVAKLFYLLLSSTSVSFTFFHAHTHAMIQFSLSHRIIISHRAPQSANQQFHYTTHPFNSTCLWTLVTTRFGMSNSEQKSREPQTLSHNWEKMKTETKTIKFKIQIKFKFLAVARCGMCSLAHLFENCGKQFLIIFSFRHFSHSHTDSEWAHSHTHSRSQLEYINGIYTRTQTRIETNATCYPTHTYRMPFGIE